MVMDQTDYQWERVLCNTFDALLQGLNIPFGEGIAIFLCYQSILKYIMQPSPLLVEQLRTLIILFLCLIFSVSLISL